VSAQWDVAILRVTALPPGRSLVAVARPLPIELPAVPSRFSVTVATGAGSGAASRAGDRVCVLGHALFAPPSGLKPSATAGVLSRVVRVPLLHTEWTDAVAAGLSASSPRSGAGAGAAMESKRGAGAGAASSAGSAGSSDADPPRRTLVPVLLQTDAAVHGGNSGGMLREFAPSCSW
jgi:hypothetical protein